MRQLNAYPTLTCIKPRYSAISSVALLCKLDMTSIQTLRGSPTPVLSRAFPSPKYLGFAEGTVLIGYARVSTDDQNPDLQLDALRAAGCVQVFVETVSGAAVERPQLRAALEAAQSGCVLAVWKLDRLARSLLQMIETVRELDTRGIGFISLTENINTTTPAGRLVLHIFGALAEFERSIMMERTLAGLVAARARGRVGGRPRKLAAEDIVIARALLSQSDLTVEEIAARLNVSVSTLYARVGGRRGSAQAVDVID